MQTLSEKQPPSIFSPISSQIITLIQNEQQTLESLFIINGNKSQQTKATLTNKYLALCQLGWFKNSYHYYTVLNQSLKFQIIYETDLTVPNSLDSIYSKKVGFRLVKIGTSPVQFIITSEDGNMIDIWINFLSRSLNQLGFHRLYRPIKKLGKGGFAIVYQVERLTDRLHFAVKAFSKQNRINIQNQSHRLTLLNQIKIMRALDSPNVIKLQGVFQSDNSLYIVLELISAGQLHSRINKRQGNFTMGQIKQFIFGLAKGLKQIHQNGIMHRDIKPQNIMLRYPNTLQPVIADFGLAAFVNSQDYIFYRCGTPGYVAPEITTLVKGQKVDPVCDVFSAGVIFHIFLTKKTLFQGRKFQQVYQNNRNLKFNLNSHVYDSVDPLAMDLLKKMLKIDPRQRIRPKQILQHPFLQGWVIESQKEELSLTKTVTSCKNKCIYT